MVGALAPARILCALQLLLSAQDSAAVAPRSSYDIPLAKLAVYSTASEPLCDKVRISWEGSDDHSVITPYDDQYVKVTRQGRETTVFREDIHRAFLISDFEAKELIRVCKSFIATLKQFEENLQRGRWARCLYLDAYFPRFLSGFYHLYCAARNSSDAMPIAALPAESLYDVSLASPKTDTRVNAWRANPEHILKLRIISKELMHQLQTWQDKELSVSRRNREVSYGEELEKAFTLFNRYYFNLSATK